MDVDNLLGKVVRENQIRFQLVTPQLELATANKPIVTNLRKETRRLLQIVLVVHQLRRK